MEGVGTLLAFAAHKGFKVYQMDVKSSFFNGILEEEVYIEQPNAYALTYEKDMVCILHKALYGLKQAPRAWYESLHSHLMKISTYISNMKEIRYWLVKCLWMILYLEVTMT